MTNYLPNDEESKHFACLLQWDNIYYQPPTQDFIPHIPTRNFIWVSGVTGTSFDNIGPELLGRGRRIKVDEHNKVIGLDNVFAIGDVSIMTAEKDYPNGHPQLAQVAIQQGDLLASNLKNMEKVRSLNLSITVILVHWLLWVEIKLWPILIN